MAEKSALAMGDMHSENLSTYWPLIFLLSSSFKDDLESNQELPRANLKT